MARSDFQHAAFPEPPVRPAAPISYLICAEKRTGSTLLCDYLRKSGVAGRPKEYFNPLTARHPADFERRFGPSPFAEFLRRVKVQRSRDGVLGAKIFWDQMEWFLDGLSGLPDVDKAPAARILDLTFPNLHYIWLRRRDTVRQAISLIRARQTKVWWSTVAPADPGTEPVFDLQELGRWVVTVRRGDAAWQRFFEQNGIRPFTLYYEDLARDPEGITREILRFLGIEVPDSLVFPPPRFERQADATTEAWVRRYEALSRVWVE